MLELKASNQLLSDARLRAETAHQHLLDAIESISDAFVLFDPQQRIVLFNERFRALWVDSRARIGPGMRRAELHRLARSGGLIVEEQRGGDQQTLYRLRDERWLRMSERLDPRRRAGGTLQRRHRDQAQRDRAPRAGAGAEVAPVAAGGGQPLPGRGDGRCRRRAGVVEPALPGTLRAGADRRAPGLRRSHGGERIAVAHAVQPGLPGESAERPRAAPVRWPGAGDPYPCAAHRRLRQHLHRHHRTLSPRRGVARQRALDPPDHRPGAGADRLSQRRTGLRIHQQGLRGVVPLAQRLDALPLPARRAWRRALPAPGTVLRAGPGRRKRDLRDRRDRVVRRGALHAALLRAEPPGRRTGSPGCSC